MLNPDFKKNLLRLLAENARRPLEDIADRLETTPEKVASAITELEEANEIVGYCALIDESVLPEAAVKAIIEIKIRPEREGGFDRIARRLSKYPQVTSLYLMSGGFELYRVSFLWPTAVTLSGMLASEVCYAAGNRAGFSGGQAWGDAIFLVTLTVLVGLCLIRRRTTAPVP